MTDATPIVRINGLPHVTQFTTAMPGRHETGWRYRALMDEPEESLRIEIVTYTWEGEIPEKERHEVRLVSGFEHEPKVHYTVKIKKWNMNRISDAVWRVRQEFIAERMVTK